MKGTTRVDKVLTEASIKFKNAAFVIDQILPVLPVNNRTGKYAIFGKEHFRVSNDFRANGAPSKRVESASVTFGTYSTERHALHDVITEDDRSEADAPIDTDLEVTEGLTEKILLRRESDGAGYLFNTATFAGYTAAVAHPWSDKVNGDPIDDGKTARSAVKLQIGRVPNVALIGEEAFDDVCEHPDVIERMKYTQLGVAAEDILAKLWKIDKVIVGQAVYDSAKEGQASSLSRLWGRYCLFAYVPPRASLRTPALGYMPHKKLYGTNVAKVKKWYDEDISGDKIEVEWEYDQILTAVSAGYLLSGI